MADSSSSTTQTGAQTAPHLFPTTENLIPSSLKFLMTHIKALSNTPLTSETYPIWQAQLQKLFSANGFQSFLDDSTQPLPKFIHSDSGKLTQNPQYTQWKLVDQNLSAAIYSTISPSILSYVLNLNTMAEI